MSARKQGGWFAERRCKARRRAKLEDLESRQRRATREGNQLVVQRLKRRIRQLHGRTA